MELGPIDGLVLLGGGEILRRLVSWSIDPRIEIRVVTSTRHAGEVFEGESLSEFLSRNNVKFIETDNIDSQEVEEFMSETLNSLYLSLGAAWIFTQSTIESLFQNRLLNCHGTRLPNNRGGGGFSWQIMMGNRFGFTLLHKVNSGIDTGPIVAYEEFVYPGRLRTPIEFEFMYTQKTVKFITDLITRGLAEKLILNEVQQSEYFSSYWPRLNSEVSGWIDWSLPAKELENFICAFDDPYKGAHTMLNRKKLYIKKVCLSPQDGVFHTFQRGIVYRVSKSWICVAIPGSTLIIQEITDENGLDFLENIRVGDRFVTPGNYLVESMSRVIYTPTGIQSE